MSTAALVLQRRDKRDRETTRCEVEVGLYDMLDQVVGQVTLRSVNVRLINHSEHQVRWEGAAFHKQGGGPDGWLVPTGNTTGPRLPLTIASRAHHVSPRHFQRMRLLSWAAAS